MIIQLGGDTLCDGADRAVDKNAGPANLSVSAPVSAQVADFLRSAAVQVFNRQNMRAEVSFEVKRQLGSVAAAAIYCFSHPAAIARSGTLTIQEGQTASIANTVLETVNCTQIGATVHIAYKLTGGAISIA